MTRTLLQRFDQHLLDSVSPDGISRLHRCARELLYFGIKQARACLFAGLFFVAMFFVPREGMLLVLMTFTIVANLKHFKASVHVPPK